MADSSGELVDDELMLDTSPLAQYLHEIGLDDFDSFHSDSRKSDNAHNVTNKDQKDQCNFPINLVAKSYDLFAPVFRYNVSAPRTEEFLYDCACQILHILQRSSYLQDFCFQKEKLRRNGYGRKEIGLTTQVSWILLFIVALQMSIVITLISDATYISTGNRIILTIIFIFSVPASAFLLWQCTIIQRTKCTCKRALQAARVLTKTLDAFSQVLDKSLLLIREYEIVAKGITFYHPSLPVLKMGAQRRGMCCVLRTCMFQSMLQSFKTIKEKAVNLMKYLPMDMKVIYEQDSICNISDSEIMSCFGMDTSINENDISTDALKSLICLNKMQITEILQQVAISIYRIITEEKEITHHSLNPFFNFIGEDFLRINPTLETIVEDLESKCAFTKENEFRATLIPKNSRVISGKKDRQSNLMMLIDSATLHLKSSLERLQLIETIIENSFQTDKNLEKEIFQDKATSSDLKASISAFILNIDGARNCIENLESKLQFKAKPEAQNNAEKEAQLDVNSSESVLTSNVIDFSLLEPEGDLLFEGISDPVSNHANVLEEDTLLAEQRKQEVKESKKIINELKAIFALKKSPVGLLPFEFVREGVKMEYAIDDEETNDAIEISTEDGNEKEHKNESMSMQHVDETFSTIGLGNAESTESMIDCYRSNCSANIMTDLTAALNKRFHDGNFSEELIETDTFDVLDDVVQE